MLPQLTTPLASSIALRHYPSTPAQLVLWGAQNIHACWLPDAGLIVLRWSNPSNLSPSSNNNGHHTLRGQAQSSTSRLVCTISPYNVWHCSCRKLLSGYAPTA